MGSHDIEKFYSLKLQQRNKVLVHKVQSNFNIHEEEPNVKNGKSAKTAAPCSFVTHPYCFACIVSIASNWQNTIGIMTLFMSLNGPHDLSRKYIVFSAQSLIIPFVYLVIFIFFVA